MKKKFVFLVFVVAMLLSFSSASMADPIKSGDSVYLTGGINGTNGGPFVVHEIGDSTTFLTFCLERNENVILGTNYVYSVTINDYAYAGGISGGPQDYISDQTAVLYSSFLSGFITNVDALQVAIWKLEGEEGGDPYDAAKWATYWATYGTEAQALIDFANAVCAAGWTNSGFIKVLNLYNADGTPAQSMLINVPEPISLLLLGFGLLGLSITRKLKK